MQKYIKEVAKGKRGAKDLSYEDTKMIAHSIFDREATDAQIAAYFIAQRIKMESSDELLAFVHAIQERTDHLPIDVSVGQKTVDFAGPYTGRNKFASTIPSAILLAEKGVPAFLHSSDSLPPRYGSSIKDIMEELDIPVDQSVEQLVQSLNTVKLGFAWTDHFCRPLTRVRSIREEIGVRTLLNTVEKLTNIANAKSIMMGAFHRTAIVKIAPIFKNLSYEKVHIVQGVEGSEDVPVHRSSFIYTITEDKMDSFIVNPKDYGVFAEQMENEKLTKEQQATFILAILRGEQSPALDYYYNQVVFNTGIRYFLYDVAESIEEGIEIAKEQLKAGKGMTTLNEWRRE